MDDIWAFKNFNLGRELETAGNFVYESAKKMFGIGSYYNEHEVSMILYTGAVGIERLQKILLSLFCINKKEDLDNHTSVLYGHNHIDLHNEIIKYVELKLTKKHISMLGVFQDYYNQYRYGNYQINNKQDVRLLLSRFFNKANVLLDVEGIYSQSQKDSFSKVFINSLGEIARKYYNEIYDKACELNMFTYEIDSGSNATRVFWTQNEKTLFEQLMVERISAKELLLFIHRYNGRDGIFDFMNNNEPLDIDPALTNECICELCKGIVSDTLYNYVEELYTDFESEKEKKSRKTLIDLIGNMDFYI